MGNLRLCVISLEPPKKKSSKQRFKDLKKKETGGDLMDAYTDKPAPQEVNIHICNCKYIIDGS